MAAKQYISVLSDTKVTGQQVKMTNTSNEFTGKLISADPNGGQASDVRDLFISEIQVDGQSATSEKVNGKKVVNIHIPEYGGGQENVIEGISVNNRRVYPNSNKIVNITIPEDAPIKSISLVGVRGGEIPATVDENGHAVIRLEEIEFDELHTDVLYLGDKNILDMIPDLSGSSTIQEAQNVSIPSGFDIDELAEKYNDLVAKFNALLSIVKNARNA